MTRVYKIIDWVILILTFVFKPVILWNLTGFFLGGIFVSDDIRKEYVINDLKEDVTFIHIPIIYQAESNLKEVFEWYQLIFPFSREYFTVKFRKQQGISFSRNLDISGFYVMKYRGHYYSYYNNNSDKLSQSLKNQDEYVSGIETFKKYYLRFLMIEFLVVITLAVYGYFRKVTLKGNKLYFFSLSIWVFFLLANALRVLFLHWYL